MNEQDKSKLLKLVGNHLGLGSREVKPEDKLLEDLGADSLDTVELVMFIEEDFRVEITDEESENITTIQDIITLLDRKQAAQ